MVLRSSRKVSHGQGSSSKTRLYAIVFLVSMCITLLFIQSDYSHISSSISSSSSSKLAVDGSNLDLKDSTKVDMEKLAKSGKIITCPRCRLNSLPKVKAFVYEQAKHFEPQLQVEFILGRDPVLHLYEYGKEVSSVDLAVSEEFV